MNEFKNIITNIKPGCQLLVNFHGYQSFKALVTKVDKASDKTAIVTHPYQNLIKFIFLEDLRNTDGKIHSIYTKGTPYSCALIHVICILSSGRIKLK